MSIQVGGVVLVVDEVNCAGADSADGGDWVSVSVVIRRGQGGGPAFDGGCECGVGIGDAPSHRADARAMLLREFFGEAVGLPAEQKMDVVLLVVVDLSSRVGLLFGESEPGKQIVK